jgi:hypothetical protein
MNFNSLRVFGAIFAMLVLAFLVHLLVLGAGSRFSFVWNVEQAKDISTGLGLFSAIFSGFAAFGLLYTIFFQNESHKLQNKQIEQGAALQVRMLHFELLKLSINDPELEKVWDSGDGSKTSELSGKQSMYANLILAHWEMMFTNDLMTEQQLRNLLSDRKQGLISVFWHAKRDFRRKHAEAAKAGPQSEWRVAEARNRSFLFHKVVDDIFQEGRIKSDDQK